MKAEIDYRQKKRLEFIVTGEDIDLEDWQIWQFHHALMMALKIITCGRRSV